MKGSRPTAQTFAFRKFRASTQHLKPSVFAYLPVTGPRFAGQFFLAAQRASSVKIKISAFLRHQRLVVSALNDSALLKHNYFIRIPDC